jgi:hypothetical protein
MNSTWNSTVMAPALSKANIPMYNHNSNVSGLDVVASVESATSFHTLSLTFVDTESTIILINLIVS